MIKKIRLVVLWLVGAYLAQMFFKMGWVKFDPEGFWTAAFDRWNYPAWLRILVGGVEVAGALLLLVPWVASYGAISLFVIMLGAWITRFSGGRMTDVMWITLYMAALAWAAYEWWFLRRPRLGGPRAT